MSMKLEIVTPLGSIYEGDIKQVTLPGKEGEFGVLEGHAALVSLLDAGVIDVSTSKNKSILVAINGGYVKVGEDKTLCIVDGAVVVNDEEGKLSANIDAAKDLLKSTEASGASMAHLTSKIESVGK